MSKHVKYKRTFDEIMKARFVRVQGEAPQRYPLTYPVLMKMSRDKKINVYGSPKMLDTVEFETQMKAGFPIIKS
jgi:hypothetical protein